MAAPDNIISIKQPFLVKITRHSDIVLAIMMVCIIGILVLPLPPTILDFLLAFNITLALVVLLVTMYIKQPLELSVFPGLLLILTLFRLSLNVASTRLILGSAYAGEVIESFGNFVVAGNYVVGFIVFAILVIIQFVVITKGAGRIAEVAARFTLDAMPGKQMAIDADLNAGLITEDEARTRREKIAVEADFHGAMDGASKFVRGDAIAGILITIINVIGGIIIGSLQMGMPISDALKTYTILTVGDGLVTQIPALIIATSAGIIVTRTSSDTNLGKDLTKQITSYPRAILIASVLLFSFGMVPGLPTFPFMLLGGVVGGVALSAIKAKKIEEQKSEVAVETAAEPEEKIEDYLKVDTLEIEIGYGLIPLVDSNGGSDLLDRITVIRRQIAAELGLVVPPVRIRDNVSLKPHEYQIKIRGIGVASSTLYPGQALAIDPGTISNPIAGIETNEPAFDLPAIWIEESQRQIAEKRGYTVVEPTAVLATHLTEVIKSHAAELITRQEVSKLIDTIKTDHQALIEELIPNLLNVGQIQHVLQNLLFEKVPIRDLPTILETLADLAPNIKESDILSEYVRQALARTISNMFLDNDGGIKVVTLDAELEKIISDSIQNSKQGILAILPPEVAQGIINEVAEAMNEMAIGGYAQVILTSPNIRLAFRRLIAAALPKIAVVSFNELMPDIEVESIKTVRFANGD
ncbi:MAG: flagellar biosynthesis protein FlhA [Candidatus Zixiibacteriota bacterium]|nr:MAG: flagellar biosynthesis protein FlhA [candidate division Zixibacteria bacterium]